MAFNLEPFGKVLGKMMFGDKCTITRIESAVDEYGATKPNNRKEVFKDIPCKFSFSEKDDPTDTTGIYMPVLKQVVVFLNLDYDIIAGDYISGYRESEEGIKQLVDGICGEPNRFDIHQEIPIKLVKEN